MVYLITYDLKAEGRDYNDLYDKIKSLGNNFHPLESTWFIKSSLPVNDISSHLRTAMDDNDYLFVVDITRQGRQGWMAKTAWEWLRNNESE